MAAVLLMSASDDSGFQLDRRALARAFDRAASAYDAAAVIQRRTRDGLLERLAFFALEPAAVLDLGAGTGQAAKVLQRRFPRAAVLALDLAPAMLRAGGLAARRPWSRWRGWRSSRLTGICADAAALPIADHSIDLIFSNLMLQWCDRPEQVYRELVRVLKPRGLFLFSTFGPETLRELRTAWSAADDGRHISDFPDLPQLAEGLMHAGLNEPVLDVESHQLLYPDARALMRELKHIGASNAARDRPRGLTGRARLERMLAAYERLRRPGGLPATYEIFFGAAYRSGLGTGAVAHAPGALGSVEQAVPLSSIRRRER
jgi:malonyl-CoA O-methyltransferase